MKILYFIICFYFLLEISIFYLIKKFKNIKWIITNKKLHKLFSKKKFEKFKNKNFNYDLGWDKKPNYKNFDLINDKKIFYSIDKKGFRKSKFKYKPNLIASYGDSYTFCRQVNNEDTWQEAISKKGKIFVSNYGVGNYGLDQAYLKYNLKRKSKKTKHIIFGFVPETICRIQSSWKNYIEFGNLHGFKPYCEYKNNKIIIKPNPLKKNSNFSHIKKIVNFTKLNDRFYKEKYLKYLFKFPYVLSFIRNYTFNLKIFFKIMSIKNTKKLNDIDLKVFPIVMQSNIKISHKFYKENYSKILLKKLLFKISNQISKKKIKCHFVIFPQLFDLKLSSRINYQNFFEDLKKDISVIDLTDNFLKKNYGKLFINDKYGGHLNKKGNIFVAKIIQKKLNLAYERNI